MFRDFFTGIANWIPCLQEMISYKLFLQILLLVRLPCTTLGLVHVSVIQSLSYNLHLSQDGRPLPRTSITCEDKVWGRVCRKILKYRCWYCKLGVNQRSCTFSDQYCLTWARNDRSVDFLSNAVLGQNTPPTPWEYKATTYDAKIRVTRIYQTWTVPCRLVKSFSCK